VATLLFTASLFLSLSYDDNDDVDDDEEKKKNNPIGLGPKTPRTSTNIHNITNTHATI
jgi:hypothetical protein